ncbi:hypothetical protein VT52_020085 [Streptomyces malaysiense]|uniref:Lipoprotein n=1 Tax=Streptomyces malaysiense TaxID=1428626 RepID=A0A1J4Q0C9_9ACTN|nr:hypothetical protein VT52_020085 [Streptomyces malaysiense]
MRRGRTAAPIAVAAALGIVAGGCAGYVVQAERPPTRPAPLSQPVLRQGKGTVPVLTAAEDRQVRTDGDLRKLLLPKPRGARDSVLAEGTDGWLDLAGYAGDFNDPGGAFRDQLADEFRRAAVTSWKSDGTYDIEIRLVQYRQETKPAAHEEAGHEQYWSSIEPDTDNRPVPGTGDGVAYVHHRPQTQAGYQPQYKAEAAASRGDILMEVWVHGSKPVPMKTVLDLAKRQVGRL